jgi:hypothetical protein
MKLLPHLRGTIRNESPLSLPARPRWDADSILSRMLEKMEAPLQGTREVCSDLPLYTVEAPLAERFRAALPGVRFTPEDLRGRAAQISSGRSVSAPAAPRCDGILEIRVPLPEQGSLKNRKIHVPRG